jgi:hypothetical protein
MPDIVVVVGMPATVMDAQLHTVMTEIDVKAMMTAEVNATMSAEMAAVTTMSAEMAAVTTMSAEMATVTTMSAVVLGETGGAK